MADITIDTGKEPISRAKINKLGSIVQTEFFKRGIIKSQKPGEA
jgi:hypothetical protein